MRIAYGAKYPSIESMRGILFDVMKMQTMTFKELSDTGRFG